MVIALNTSKEEELLVSRPNFQVGKPVGLIARTATAIRSSMWLLGAR